MEGIGEREILITGGTGTLGKALTRELIKDNSYRGIRIFSRDEEKHRVMREEFGDNKRISYLVGDVADKDRLYRAMNGVDIVIHTAAMKQVPACEENPIEAVKTNIDGTVNVIDCSINNEVEKVFFISTDKAVKPLNLYGATKCVAEKLILDANLYSPHKTKFSCCRYGNILGSRGSVLRMWEEQLEYDFSICVTSNHMTRFWLKKESAVNFIIKCISRMIGGEIFIPEMKSCTMKDFAEAYIKRLDIDATIREIGVRPGEKIHEEIAVMGETVYIVGDKTVKQHECKDSINSLLTDKYTQEELTQLMHEVMTNG
ncbi:MAG: SDR family NAD(P)-dependent oxidoreductase [Methanogenium sp.]|jgi:FlaA1/EpsC-like NDP-sugar epimerase